MFDIDDHFKDGFEGANDLRGIKPNWEAVQAGLPKIVLGSALLGKLIYSKIAGISLATITAAAAVTVALLPDTAPQDVYEPLGRGGASTAIVAAVSDQDFVEEAAKETREWFAVHRISISKPRSVQVLVNQQKDPVTNPVDVFNRRTRANISLISTEKLLGLGVSAFRSLDPVMPEDWCLDDLGFDERLAVVPAHVIRQIDSAVLASLEPAPKANSQLLARWEISILAGASWAKGFSNITEEAGTYKVSPLLGLALEYNVNTRFSVLGEMHYFRRSGNSLRYSTVENQFFLRQERVTRQVTIQSLEYLQVPISVRYRLHDNHSFTGGLFTSYLLNTVSERRDVVESNASYQEANLGSRKGYMDGLNRLSYGLSIGYELQAARRVTFGARINQGLNDVTQGSLSQEAGVNSSDLNRDYQFYVRLKLY